jgi:hypothetical protein
MNWRILPVIAAAGLLALAPAQTNAATCVNGAYNAGCAGPNGAVAVHKAPYAPAPYYQPPVYAHPPSTVTCASGVYRAGCAGPNGAAVVTKPY